MNHGWTPEKIAALTPLERGNLLANALAKKAQDIVDMISESGLPTKEGGGLNADHPAIVSMREVCFSDVGIRLAEEAISNGLPPLAGVDLLIKQTIPKYYGEFDTTTWAGTFIAEAMMSKGYVSDGKQGKMPEGSVAKTAKLFRTKRR